MFKSKNIGNIVTKNHKTPLKTIRQYCVRECMNDNQVEVALCTSPGCALYSYRFGKRGENEKSPIKSIHAYCVDCSDGNRNVSKCDFLECALFPYRCGHNPALKGKGGNPNIGHIRALSLNPAIDLKTQP
jgi:hypothetical protein